MLNTIYSKRFDRGTKIIGARTRQGYDEDITIELSDKSTIHLKVDTGGDCCAMAYLDTSQFMLDVKHSINEDISYFILKAVPGIGVIAELSPEHKSLIPCYESNNGYYSTYANIKITYTKGETIEQDVVNFMGDTPETILYETSEY